VVRRRSMERILGHVVLGRRRLAPCN
jgi:hypothetical protein